MRKRDRDVRNLNQPNALEGKFVGYTEGDDGYLVYVPNTQKVLTVRDVIIKESEVGSNPENTETPDLLDEGSPHLGIWDSAYSQQNDDNKKKQGTSIALNEEWHDTESVNTRETTLRRDASDVEEAVPDKDSSATRRSLRESVSLQDSDTEGFSQSQTVELFEEDLGSSGQGRAQVGNTSKQCSVIFWRSQDPTCCD